MAALLAAAVLVASGIALALASLIVVPAPTSRLWLVGVLVAGYSLVVAGGAIVLIVLAGVAIAMGAVVLGGVAACVAAVTFALALLPVVEGVRAARAQDIHLSVRTYWSRPAWTGQGSPETFVFSEPPDTTGGLALDVWRPRSEARAAVVLIHGGGWVSGGRGGAARWNEWLAEQGYVVFDIDYRLAPPPRWEDAVDDVTNAIEWVREKAARFAVAPHLVGVIGWSAGGHLALLAAYRAHVAAVAAFFPITDLRTVADGCRPRWAEAAARAQVEAFLGGPVAERFDAARLASPIEHVDDAVPPTLLVHGTSDQLVSVRHSDVFGAALSKVGVDHESVRLPGANHAFDLAWGAWSTQVARGALGRFLERHLGPSPGA